MNLKLSFYNALCSTEVFEINGIMASSRYFGEQKDNEPEKAEPYCCHDMKFTRILPTKEVLTKYNINEKEYNEICDILERGLSFGRCAWCE